MLSGFSGTILIYVAIKEVPPIWKGNPVCDRISDGSFQCCVRLSGFSRWTLATRICHRRWPNPRHRLFLRRQTWKTVV